MKGAVDEENLPKYLGSCMDTKSEHLIYTPKQRAGFSDAHLPVGGWYLDCDGGYVPESERVLFEQIEGAPPPEAAPVAPVPANKNDNDDFQEDAPPRRGRKRGRLVRANAVAVAPVENVAVTRSAARAAPVRAAAARVVPARPNVDNTAASSLHDQVKDEQEDQDTLTQEQFPLLPVAAITRRHVPASSTVTNSSFPAAPLPQLIECGDMEDLLQRFSISKVYDPVYHKIMAYLKEV